MFGGFDNVLAAVTDGEKSERIGSETSEYEGGKDKKEGSLIAQTAERMFREKRIFNKLNCETNLKINMEQIKVELNKNYVHSIL